MQRCDNQGRRQDGTRLMGQDMEAIEREQEWGRDSLALGERRVAQGS